MSIAEKESDDDPAIPLAPSDLARAYADMSIGYHKRLPAIEARIEKMEEKVDTVHGIALASHGLLSRLALRVEEIGSAVRAPRTFSSGSFPAVSVPVPSMPLEIRTQASKTGAHQLIENEEIARLKAMFAEKEAEERGAKEALAQLQMDEALRESRSKATRDRWAFALAIGVAICSAVAWAIGHLSAK